MNTTLRTLTIGGVHLPILQLRGDGQTTKLELPSSSPACPDVCAIIVASLIKVW